MATTPSKLNNEQVDRLLIAIEHMKGDNVIADVIWRSLKAQANKEQKKRVMVGAFAMAYSLLLVMNMAVQSNVNPSEFKASLIAAGHIQKG